MALSPNEIHVGPANIYMGVTAPASGAPPTWMTHTNGVPGTGTHVGATMGEATFSWNTDKSEIEVEQALGTIDMYITKENATLEFEAAERNYLLMKAAFDNIGNVSDVTRTGFYGGGGGTIINIQYTTIFLSSPRKDQASKYEILVLYKCVSVAGMPIKYSRTSPSTYRVSFRCLPDTTRTTGDQIFQFSREK